MKQSKGYHIESIRDQKQQQASSDFKSYFQTGKVKKGYRKGLMLDRKPDEQTQLHPELQNPIRPISVQSQKGFSLCTPSQMPVSPLYLFIFLLLLLWFFVCFWLFFFLSLTNHLGLHNFVKDMKCFFSEPHKTCDLKQFNQVDSINST